MIEHMRILYQHYFLDSYFIYAIKTKNKVKYLNSNLYFPTSTDKQFKKTSLR